MIINKEPYRVVERAAEALGGWKELQERLGITRQCASLWRRRERTPGASYVLECMRIIRSHEERSSRQEALEAEFS